MQVQRLVQALAQIQTQRLVQEPELELVQEPLQVLEQVRQQELAAAPEQRQVRELRVSR